MFSFTFASSSNGFLDSKLQFISAVEPAGTKDALGK